MLPRIQLIVSVCLLLLFIIDFFFNFREIMKKIKHNKVNLFRFVTKLLLLVILLITLIINFIIGNLFFIIFYSCLFLFYSIIYIPTLIPTKKI